MNSPKRDGDGDQKDPQHRINGIVPQRHPLPIQAFEQAIGDGIHIHKGGDGRQHLEHPTRGLAMKEQVAQRFPIEKEDSADHHRKGAGDPQGAANNTAGAPPIGAGGGIGHFGDQEGGKGV